MIADPHKEAGRETMDGRMGAANLCMRGQKLLVEDGVVDHQKRMLANEGQPLYPPNHPIPIHFSLPTTPPALFHR